MHARVFVGAQFTYGATSRCGDLAYHRKKILAHRVCRYISEIPLEEALAANCMDTPSPVVDAPSTVVDAPSPVVDASAPLLDAAATIHTPHVPAM